MTQFSDQYGTRNTIHDVTKKLSFPGSCNSRVTVLQHPGIYKLCKTFNLYLGHLSINNL